jgi:hypothetical protein
VDDWRTVRPDIDRDYDPGLDEVDDNQDAEVSPLAAA